MKFSICILNRQLFDQFEDEKLDIFLSFSDFKNANFALELVDLFFCLSRKLNAKKLVFYLT